VRAETAAKWAQSEEMTGGLQMSIRDHGEKLLEVGRRAEKMETTMKKSGVMEEGTGDAQVINTLKCLIY
jgi:hypothetical protein